MDFIRCVLDPEVQRTTYYVHGGQPGHLSAWTDAACNEDSGGFFINTLNTLQHAYRRTGVPGFNRFQEAAADLVHRWVKQGADGAVVMPQLNNLYQTMCHDQI